MFNVVFGSQCRQPSLSHSDLGRDVPIKVVRLISKVVRLARSIMALVSECLGIVSFRVVPLCLSSSPNLMLRNSPPQSAFVRRVVVLRVG